MTYETIIMDLPEQIWAGQVIKPALRIQGTYIGRENLVATAYISGGEPNALHDSLAGVTTVPGVKKPLKPDEWEFCFSQLVCNAPIGSHYMLIQVHPEGAKLAPEYEATIHTRRFWVAKKLVARTNN